MSILITGGAGYIGSHTLISLHNAGYDFIVYDNLSNSSKESIKRVEKIIGKYIFFEEGDIRDKKALDAIFKKYNIDAVIHFAGLKAVGKSVSNPLEYYDNNINGTTILLQVMKKHNCKSLVFSSSATVYNEVKGNKYTPLKENFPTGVITNPYGRTKYFIEEMLKDLSISDPDFKIVILRYFNPVGAHESGTIGEDPKGTPNNLMPFISQVAVGKRDCLYVFGNDYDTPDGTGVRDYIHVSDLADAHVKALSYINSKSYNKKDFIFNIGTGIGYSVLDMIKAFEKASGKEVPYEILERRAVDIATCYSDPSHAKHTLNWEAKKTIEDMCADSWKWQMNNPDGYICNLTEKLND